MSMFPLVRVELEPGLSAETKQNLHENIKRIPGVLSAKFNGVSDAMVVTYQDVTMFTMQDMGVAQKIAALPGVKKLHPMV